MLAPRVHATMDKLSGVQLGLEASMLAHKQELLQKFGERLEHSCQTAEDTAFQRAKQYLVPGLETLGQQLNAHKREAELNWERTARDISELSEKLRGAYDNIGALHEHADSAVARLEELGTQLAQDAQCRDTRCQELSAQIHELSGAALVENQRRASVEIDLSERIEAAKEEAQRTTRRSTERADDQFIKMQERAKALEMQFLQDVAERVVQCLQDAKNHTEHVAGQIRLELQDAMFRAEQKLVLSDTQMAELVKASIETLRKEQAEADKRILAAAEQSLEHKADLLSSQFEDGFDSVGRQIEDMVTQGKAALHSSITDLEGRLADRDAGIMAEMQALKDAIEKGDTGRIHLRRALQAESQQSKTANAELSRASAHAVSSVEARLQRDVVELRASLTQLQTRLSKEADVLRAEVGQRPTIHEVSEVNTAHSEQCHEIASLLDGTRWKLKETEAGMSERYLEMQRQANDAQTRSQQEMAALGNEITQLRTATTSLTNGVVKALQIIGLLETTPWVGAGLAGAKEDLAGFQAAALGSAQASGGAETRVPPPRKRVEVEDLLQWERAGNSLASRVAQHWQGRQLSSAPTLLAALDQRLEVESHSVAKELLRNAAIRLDGSALEAPRTLETPRSLPMVKTGLSVVAPPAPRGPLPSGLAHMRRQRGGSPIVGS